MMVIVAMMTVRIVVVRVKVVVYLTWLMFFPRSTDFCCKLR